MNKEVEFALDMHAIMSHVTKLTVQEDRHHFFETVGVAGLPFVFFSSSSTSSLALVSSLSSALLDFDLSSALFSLPCESVLLPPDSFFFLSSASR